MILGPEDSQPLSSLSNNVAGAKPPSPIRAVGNRGFEISYRSMHFSASERSLFYRIFVSNNTSIMSNVLTIVLSLVSTLSVAIAASAEISIVQNVRSFSAVGGSLSRAGEIVITCDSETQQQWTTSLSGDNAEYFSISSEKAERDSLILEVLFRPPSSFIGVATASLSVKINGQPEVNLSLKGLNTKGLEGKNEPPLSDVLTTLGFATNVGWRTLGNHIKSDLQGEELAPMLFSKATEGDVEIYPLARYSPSFELPFGYYTEDGQRHQVGVLSADKLPVAEHQTLFPALREGKTAFDPGDQPFGIYHSSPTHTAFSEDKWNRKENEKGTKRHAVHACRIYPARSMSGEVLPNEYLFCFEEAANGDYQDYVFLVRNLKPENSPDSGVEAE